MRSGVQCCGFCEFLVFVFFFFFFLPFLSFISRLGIKCASSINFIEWSGISEAAVPYLVDGSLCLFPVLAVRTARNREYCAPPHAFLMLPDQPPLPPREEFTGPSAFATQGTGANLCFVLFCLIFEFGDWDWIFFSFLDSSRPWFNGRRLLISGVE